MYRLRACGALALTVLAFGANAQQYFAGNRFGLFDPKVEPAWTTSTGIPLAFVATAVFIRGHFQVPSESHD